MASAVLTASSMISLAFVSALPIWTQRSSSDWTRSRMTDDCRRYHENHCHSNDHNIRHRSTSLLNFHCTTTTVKFYTVFTKMSSIPIRNLYHLTDVLIAEASPRQIGAKPAAFRALSRCPDQSAFSAPDAVWLPCVAACVGRSQRSSVCSFDRPFP